MSIPWVDQSRLWRLFYPVMPEDYRGLFTDREVAFLGERFRRKNEEELLFRAQMRWLRRQFGALRALTELKGPVVVTVSTGMGRNDFYGETAFCGGEAEKSRGRNLPRQSPRNSRLPQHHPASKPVSGPPQGIIPPTGPKN